MGEPQKSRLRTFNRIIVWPTLVLLILLTLSGYGTSNPGLLGELTGGLLNHPTLLKMHTDLALPTLILLTTHILIALRTTLIRWGVRTRLLDVFVVLVGTFAVILMALLQYLMIPS